MNNYAAHQSLVESAKKLASKEIPRLRIFDRHVGLFYTKRISGGHINYTPIHINKKGMADLILEYPGKFSKISMEAEAKSGAGKQTEEQIIWENYTKSMNGLYFTFGTDVEFVTTVQRYLSYLQSVGMI